MQRIKLPKIDKIANAQEFQNCLRPQIIKIAQELIEQERQKALQGGELASESEIISLIKSRYEKFQNLSLKPLINATGVVLHTNLGRSVISAEILARAQKIITSYSNLEYDLSEGARGNRYDYIALLCSELFGAQDALVVNNNASAVFLVLNTFARGREVVVSRGELVEIGGSFRVPEVMSASGTTLREVGTTNKTRISDYENAISERTKMLLKVHRSNFDIVGFCQSAEIGEISALARERGLIDYYDLGGGYAGELPYNLGKDEPCVAKILQSGVSLISFSGDKLFGSVQAGIILGRRELIAKLRKNQLLRMLRVDKVIISLLCESIKAYINKEFSLISTQAQLRKSEDELTDLARKMSENLARPLEILSTQTYVGGGTLPNRKFPSVALGVAGDAEANEAKFRERGVIGRIENGKFLLDLRSVLPRDEEKLIKIISEVIK